MSAQITGTPGDDVIVATKDANWILARGGDDTIYITQSEGTAFGHAGNDTFYLSPPGRSQVHAYGGEGDDTFYLDTSSRVAPSGAHVWGGEGRDKFIFTNIGSSDARITGRIDDFDPSRDEIWVDDIRVDLSNPPENVRIVEHLGQPWILIDNRVLYALEGARQLTNPPHDSVEEIHFISWPEIWKDGVPASADIPYEDFVSYFPRSLMRTDEDAMTHLRGTGGDETLVGSDGAEYIHGRDGADTIYGHGGDDVIDGDEGNDLIYGGAGDDRLAGGLDQDVIYGGDGNDIAFGGSGHDLLYGEAGNDTLHGNSGHDLLDGGTGDDLLYGGTGNDVLIGGDGSDRLYGGAGNDLLIAGGSGADGAGLNLMDGGEGDDTLVGANGQTTTMQGGAGRDSFIPAEAGEVIITDFNPAEDLLDLRGLISPDHDLQSFMSAVPRSDDSGILDLLLTLPGGGSALVHGAGHLSAEQLAAASLRGGAPLDLEAAIAAQEALIAGTPDVFGAVGKPGQQHPLGPGDEDAPPSGGHPQPPDQPGGGYEDGGHGGGGDLPDGGEPNLGSPAPGGDEPILGSPPPLPPNDSDLPDHMIPPEDDPRADASSSHGGGGCFVATAAFGGIHHRDVSWLRQFRDTRLVYSPAGRAFIRFYWTVGPVMARYVKADRLSGRLSRKLISGIVICLKRLG